MPPHSSQQQKKQPLLHNKMLWWRGVTYRAHPNTTDTTKLWVTHHNTFNMCQTDRRNDFLLKVDSQHTCTNRSFSFMTNQLCQKTESRECKCITNLSHRGPPREDKLMRAPTKQDYTAWVIAYHYLNFMHPCSHCTQSCSSDCVSASKLHNKKPHMTTLGYDSHTS